MSASIALGVFAQVAHADESDTAEDSPAMMEQVVVTAQKRGEQKLQDVPISITAITGATLDASTEDGVAGALRTVAGVNIYGSTQNGGGTKISMRGVTAAGQLFNGTATVGYYLDEAAFGFVQSAVVPDANAYDLERVEVLRGPQGTLYGASSLNGVVRVITKDADLDTFSVKTRASVSSTEDGGQNYRSDTAINLPIIKDKLAARLVLGVNDTSGWIDKPGNPDANDASFTNARLKVNAAPTERMTIEFSGWTAHSEWGAPSFADEDGVNPYEIEEPSETDNDVYSLNIGYDFDNVSLVAATSYMDYFAANHSAYSDGTLDLITDLGSELFSQEIRLSSTGGGSFNWSLGAYYRSARDTVHQEIPGLIDLPTTVNESDSIAVFGEVVKGFFDNKLELTAGLRVFKDNQTLTEGDLPSEDTSFDTVTPRLVLAWHPSDTLSLYTSYAEGFRSGILLESYLTELGVPHLKEDKLKNYEVGAKGELLGGKLAYDTALYYIDWQDVQQTLTVGGTSDIGFTAPVNGDSASGLGFDLGVQTAPTDNFTIGFTFSWNDLTMDAEIPAFDGDVLFYKGDRLSESPEYTAGLSTDYYFPVGRSGLEGRLTGAVDYRSELTSVSVVRSQVVRAASDNILTARLALALENPSDNWTATFFIDNATNEDGVTQASPYYETKMMRLRPRTVGIQFEYAF